MMYTTIFDSILDALDDVRENDAFPFYFTCDTLDDANYVKELVKSDIAYNSYIDDSDKSYNISFALAGVSKDHIKIERTLDEVIVTIKGLDEKDNNDKRAYIHHAIKLPNHKDYVNTIEVPKEYDAQKLDVSFENGLLSIKLPLKEESKPVEIKIK